MLVFLLLIFLGNWQASRAIQKTLILEQWSQAQANNPAFINSENLDELKLKPYTKIKAAGYFLNAQQFLLDNRVYQGKAGYSVITPLLLENNDTILLVNRGFIQQGKTRNDLPKLTPVNGRITVVGKINYPSKKVFTLSNQNFEGANWPSRIQFVKIESLSNKLQKPVLPFILQLAKNSPYVFTYNPMQQYLTPERHKGYAMQWYMLAITWAVLWLLAAIKLNRK